MTSLAKFILSTAGLVMILNISKLLKPFREWVSIWYKNSGSKFSWFIDSLLNCSLCMGVWAGFLVYILMYKFESTTELFKHILSWIYGLNINAILHSFIGGCVSLLLITLYQLIERKK